MKILALDFSSAQRSLALVETTEEGSVQLLAEVRSDGGRSAPVFALIEGLLGRAGWLRAEVEGLVVGLGPGSYAGIRSSLAVAQGWQLAWSIRVAGVRSIDALALAASRRVSAGATFGTVVDAQRGEYYLAEHLAGDVVQEQETLTIVSRDHLEQRIRQGVQMFGPDLPAGELPVESCHPRAGDLAACLKPADWAESANELKPVYLRPTEFARAPSPRADL